MEKNKVTKVKEPVRIRFKKLANGSKSIYLDIYKDGVRNYEFLKLYIVPERTALDKVNNANNLAAAAAIKSQRIIDINNGKSGLNLQTSKSKMALVDFMNIFVEKKKKEQVSAARLSTINCAFVHLKYFIQNYKLKGIKIGNVTTDFCEGFETYLRTAKDTRYKDLTAEEIRQGKTPVYISEGTAYTYFAVLNYALAWGAKHNYIPSNPIDRMDITLKQKQDDKEFLTIEEVKLLAATPCKNEETKRAFLFSCFSGFRISDITRMKWQDLSTDGDKTVASLLMKKTKKRIYQPIDNSAIRWLPERGECTKDSSLVFHLRKLSAIENHLQDWGKSAGIVKHITFHTARHTYATMLITLGAELYTVSQLLGHSDTRMTQIYAKVIDSKKREAASLLESVLNEQKM